MEIRERVEAFRIQRKMTVSTLCKGIITESTYSRFKNGKTMLASDSFIALLQRLGLSFPEATQFTHQIHEVNRYKVLVHQYRDEHSSELVLELHERIMKRVKFKFDSYHILAIQINLILMKWHEMPFLHDIKDFIFKVENWTYTEMFLFQIIIDEYDAEAVHLLIQQLTDSRPDTINAEKNVHFILLLRTCFTYFLKNRYLDYAKEMCESMEDYLQTLGFTSLKYNLLISELLLEVVLDQSDETIEKIKRVYQLCLRANNSFYAEWLSSEYQNIQPIYDLPVIAFGDIREERTKR